MTLIPGMRHFAGGGPPGTQCGQCRQFRPHRCPRLGVGVASEEMLLIQSEGTCDGAVFPRGRRPPIEGSNSSCKYFEARDQEDKARDGKAAE